MSKSPSEEQPWRDEEVLRSLYEEQGLSNRDISEELGCGRRTVTNWLYKHGIKQPKGDEPYHSKEQLRDLYIEKGLSKEEIASRWDCSDLTIQRWVTRHNLAGKREVDSGDYPWRDKSRLDELYQGLGLTMREVGEILGCSHDCIRRWLNRFDIEIKRPKYRDWPYIRRIQHSESSTIQSVADELDVDVDVIDRQLAQYQNQTFADQPVSDRGEVNENRPWHDQDTLERLYIDEDLDSGEIADKFECHESTVSRWLRSFGIQRSVEKPWTDKETMRELYVNQGLTTLEIADRFSCSDSTITRWINRLEIERDEKPPIWQFKGVLETLYIEKDWTIREIGDELGCNNSTVSEWLRRHDISGGQYDRDEKYRSKSVLRNMYVQQEMPVTEIADKLGCTHATISYWLARHEIETRTRDDVVHQQYGFTPSEKPAFHDKDLLSVLYIERDMTPVEISRELGCSERAVRVQLDRHNLHNKKTNQTITLDDIEADVSDSYPWRSGEMLREMYVEKDLSIPDISELLDCSSATISTWLSKHDIDTSRDYEKPSRVELKKLYHRRGYSGSKIAKEVGVTPSTVYEWLHSYEIDIKSPSDYRHEYLDSEEKMSEMYIEQGMNISEIADSLGTHGQTVSRLLDEYGIEKRDTSEELSGENNPFWKGGKQPYGDGWTEQKRRAVLERDNHSCQSCGESQQQHREDTGQGLHIHHIIPARKIDDEDKRNDISNLVAMCSSCHSKWEGIPLRPTVNPTE